jgi:drug/metabolite transporter (DMT)-like permease
MAINKVTKGIICMVIAQSIFVLAWTGIRSVGARLPVFEITFFRAAISLIILLPITHIKHGSLRGKSWPTLTLRAVTGFVAMALSFYAMINMEFGNAVTLFNTLPIFVALLAPSLLGEPFRKFQFILVIIAFAGIVTILKPGKGLFDVVSLCALLAAFLAAIAMICIRKLRKSDSIFIITLYFTAFTAIASLPFAAMNFLWPTPTEWLWLAFIGISVTFAQLLLAHAYHLGKASVVAPFSYISVLGSFLIGMTIFGEIPDLSTIIGAIIVVVAGVSIMVTSSPSQRVPGSTPGVRN